MSNENNRFSATQQIPEIRSQVSREGDQDLGNEGEREGGRKGGRDRGVGR